MKYEDKIKRFIVFYIFVCQAINASVYFFVWLYDAEGLNAETGLLVVAASAVASLVNGLNATYTTTGGIKLSTIIFYALVVFASSIFFGFCIFNPKRWIILVLYGLLIILEVAIAFLIICRNRLKRLFAKLFKQK